MATHDRAIILNRYWAGLLSSLLAALVIGGLGYAWNANAQIAVLRSDVDDLKKAELASRLSRMEGKLDELLANAHARGRP